MIKISPSILSCDFARLKEDIDTIKDDVEYLHIDVMDGVFVNNISFGIPVVQALRPHFQNVFDVHLMICNPIKYVEAFALAGSDIITFHYESESDILETILLIKKLNKKVGMSIKPNTLVEEILEYLPYLDLVLVMSVEPGFGGQKFMPSSLLKIRKLASLREERNFTYEIEVDGGINDETAKLVKEAGVDVIVAGSYIFNAKDRKDKIKQLK